MFDRMRHSRRAAATKALTAAATFAAEPRARWYHLSAYSPVIAPPPAMPGRTTLFDRSFRVAVLTGAIGLLATACSDSPMAPVQVSSATVAQADAASQFNGNSFWSMANAIKKTRVTVLTRRSPLRRDYLVSSDIGAAGGTLTIDEAGVVITFPRNAVSRTTRITMRALAGRTVAYEFEPHGLTFDVKPTIEQDLDKTNWYQIFRGGVEGAYFADPSSLNDAADEADADEFFVTTTKGEKTLSFTIPHFSGYLVSSARF
jgi:ZU5 domain